MSAKYRFQFSLRQLLLGTAVVACVFSLWSVTIRPFQVHRRLTARIDICMEALTQKRPSSVTRVEWSFMLGWTRNAMGNCLSMPQYIEDYPRFRRFVDELERRIEGEVTIETIDWIWDEVEEISVYGKRYSESYRPTTPEH